MINYIPLLAGIWMIGMALLMHTENIQSSMVFKVIPFFLGTGCMYTAAVSLGWIMTS